MQSGCSTEGGNGTNTVCIYKYSLDECSYSLTFPPQLCSELNALPIKVEDEESAFEIFTGSHCDTVRTVLDERNSVIVVTNQKNY